MNSLFDIFSCMLYVEKLRQVPPLDFIVFTEKFHFNANSCLIPLLRLQRIWKLRRFSKKNYGNIFFHNGYSEFTMQLRSRSDIFLHFKMHENTLPQ